MSGKNWYQIKSALDILDTLSIKPKDQVYVVDDDGAIQEYGVVSGVRDGNVFGFWSDTPNDVLVDLSENEVETGPRPLDSIAVGRLPKIFIDFLSDKKDELLDVFDDFPFLQKQLEDILEVTAQSLYQLDMPLSPDIGNADGERIWRYDRNKKNLWWGEGGSKWEGGKEDVIQGLPRYNPEYHNDDVGAFFTWWEPYIEPVRMESLINLQRAVGAYYYPGKYEGPSHEYI